MEEAKTGLHLIEYKKIPAISVMIAMMHHAHHFPGSQQSENHTRISINGLIIIKSVQICCKRIGACMYAYMQVSQNKATLDALMLLAL
jgi:hypothetical protein